jgi:CubicO group peptidase (beta-lactamase class C family)
MRLSKRSPTNDRQVTLLLDSESNNGIYFNLVIYSLSINPTLLLLLGFSLCFVGEQTARAQTALRPANANPDQLRTIVPAAARKAGTKAVEFGIWLGYREILTMALGHSMTTVPATTDMHYRIGGIAETFMSTLLLMLVEQERISLDDKISRWFPNLLVADQVTVRMLVANTAGYIDYVTVDDFLKLQLAEPFRTFTDEELINYSVRDGKMNFPPGTSQQYSHKVRAAKKRLVRLKVAKPPLASACRARQVPIV